jgi:hypothetical protein
MTDSPRGVLEREARDLQNWCLGALLEREGRSEDEVAELQRAVLDWTEWGCLAAPEIDYVDASIFWEILLDILPAAADNGGMVDREVGRRWEPPVHYDEFFLAAGLVLATHAVVFFKQEDERRHWQAAQMLIYAMRCWGTWLDNRGPLHCRRPDPMWTRIKEARKGLERRFYEIERNEESAERFRIAQDKRYAGNRQRIADLKTVWASGKYKNKKECAEIEGQRLCMSYDTAYGHLKGLPRPPPRE